MIDQAEKQAIRSIRQVLFGGQATNCGLNGAELAAFPLIIDYDFVAGERYAFCDWLRVRAEYHAADSDFRVHSDVQQLLDERASMIGQERLGRAHAAGSAA